MTSKQQQYLCLLVLTSFINMFFNPLLIASTLDDFIHQLNTAQQGQRHCDEEAPISKK